MRKGFEPNTSCLKEDGHASQPLLIWYLLDICLDIYKFISLVSTLINVFNI